MPLYKEAQSHSCFDQKPVGIYSFVEDQKENWRAFWKVHNGDVEKILDFAKKSGIENPWNWVDELHLFLFNRFSGNINLLKHAASKNFNSFLAQVLKNHINNPRNPKWYLKFGVNYKMFTSYLEKAINDYEKDSDAIIFLNARIRNFGSEIHSEFILSKTNEVKNIKSIASKKNKEAYDIELKEIGNQFKIGSTISYTKFPEEEFEIIDIDTKDDYLVVEDKNEAIGYIFDTWNAQIID